MLSPAGGQKKDKGRTVRTLIHQKTLFKDFSKSMKLHGNQQDWFLFTDRKTVGCQYTKFVPHNFLQGKYNGIIIHLFVL